MPRPTKPLAVLKLEKGKLYSDQRERDRLEPKPKRELKPRCPQRFSKEERKAWKDISAVLRNYGLFTAANAIQLELLATAWAQYVETCRMMAGDNRIIMKHGGKPIYNPYFLAQHKLGQLIEKYCQNLGLSSMAMARIGTLLVKRKKEKDEFFDD